MGQRLRAALAAISIFLALPVAQQLPAAAGPLLLVEADSGKVLYAEDQDDQWYPASLTKMMTAYIVFEEMKAGRLKLDAKVPVSAVAHKEPPSKLGLPVGSEISLDLALRALIVKSANDVAVMLAEKVSGDVDSFAKRMNATARRLGMTHTSFVNPNGLPAGGQITTARDLARLARAVVRDFPEHNALWGLTDFRVGKRRLRSHNELLKSFEGADGIKTGFICDSGFNIAASATRDGRQLIAIVLGQPSGKERNITAASLLEHGFSTSPWKLLFGVPTLDSLPRDRNAKAVVSVRNSVTAWNCNGRSAKKRVVKRKSKPRPTKKAGAAAAKTQAAASKTISPALPKRPNAAGSKAAANARQ